MIRQDTYSVPDSSPLNIDESVLTINPEGLIRAIRTNALDPHRTLEVRIQVSLFDDKATASITDTYEDVEATDTTTDVPNITVHCVRPLDFVSTDDACSEFVKSPPRQHEVADKFTDTPDRDVLAAEVEAARETWRDAVRERIVDEITIDGVVFTVANSCEP